MSQATATRRVEKLNNASLARIIDPDKDLPGALGDGAVLPAELLLPTAGLDDGSLTPEQFVTFSRQALAAITQSGLMFEAILMAGFGLQIAGPTTTPTPASPTCCTSWARRPATPGSSPACSTSWARPRPTRSTTGSPTRSPAGS